MDFGDTPDWIFGEPSDVLTERRARRGVRGLVEFAGGPLHGGAG